MRETYYKGSRYVIGKDRGTFDSVTYYFIEKDGKVIDHGNIRLKNAKNKLINILTKV